MKRRTVIKWLHWSSLLFLLYFLAVEPEDVERLGATALATHSGVGAIFAITVLIWFIMYLFKGHAGRAGPKLQGWAKKLYIPFHKALTYGLVFMMFTGALLGISSAFQVKAFGIVPLFPAFNIKWLNGFAEEVHELAFNALLFGVLAHAVFHVWRHVRLRDNALKIMVPKAFHKWL